jgi:hypothetical protein
MNSSVQPRLPNWMLEVNEVAYFKMSQCELLRLIYRGDFTSLRHLIWLFWPFVDKFPRDINLGCKSIIRRLGQKGNSFRQLALSFHKTPHDLKNEYAGDESKHREYWLRMGERLNLSLHPNDTSTHEVCMLSQAVRDKDDLVRLCYRFIGVEVAAEQLTEYLMGSEKFRSHLPGNSIEWFNVHRHHPDAFHTLIGLKFAQELSEDEIDEQKAQQEILAMVDMFTSATISRIPSSLEVVQHA